MEQMKEWQKTQNFFWAIWYYNEQGQNCFDIEFTRLEIIRDKYKNIVDIEWANTVQVAKNIVNNWIDYHLDYYKAQKANVKAKSTKFSPKIFDKKSVDIMGKKLNFN